MEADLLAAFDALVGRRGYANRSEALRDLVRRELLAETWANEQTEEAVGTLTIVYDHHKRELADKLVDMGHAHVTMHLASMHVHLDHIRCLEVTALKGAPAELQAFADRVIGLKGVQTGRFVPAGAGPFPPHGHHHHH